MLVFATITALFLANGAFSDAYLHTLVSVNIGQLSLNMSLNHWVNDGLMAIFFFVVGMELKREILVRELIDLVEGRSTSNIIKK